MHCAELTSSIQYYILIWRLANWHSIEEFYLWHNTSSTLFESFTCNTLESIQLGRREKEFLGSIRSKEYELLYSYFNSFLENIFDFFVLIRHPLIEGDFFLLFCMGFSLSNACQVNAFFLDCLYLIFCLCSIAIKQYYMFSDFDAQHSNHQRINHWVREIDINRKWKSDKKSLHRNLINYELIEVLDKYHVAT